MNNNFEDDKFMKAYAHWVHEDRQDEALEICKEILDQNPKHLPARMLLANAQADSHDENERRLGRENFLLALRNCDDPSVIGKGWLEENPLYHLALWERQNGIEAFAITLYLADYLIFGTGGRSPEQMVELSPWVEVYQKYCVRLIVDKVSEWKMSGEQRWDQKCKEPPE